MKHVRSSLSIVGGLPCVTVRSAPAIVFSGPVQRSLTLRPARSRSRHATLSTESSDSFVASAAASIATGWSEPVPGRESHPLKSNAFHGALLRQLSQLNGWNPPPKPSRSLAGPACKPCARPVTPKQTIVTKVMKAEAPPNRPFSTGFTAEKVLSPEALRCIVLPARRSTSQECFDLRSPPASFVNLVERCALFAHGSNHHFYAKVRPCQHPSVATSRGRQWRNSPPSRLSRTTAASS